MSGYWGSPISLDVQSTDSIDTDRSTTETIQRMIALATYSATSSISVSTALQSAIESIRSSHPTSRELASAIWYWVKRHIVFVEDEQILAEQLGYSADPFQELLISPDVLLNMPIPQGDCDDFSTLIASMLLAVGMPAWFITIAVDGNQPWRFSHVYVKTFLSDEGKYMVMDCSHGNFPGWETNREIFRRIEWYVG